MARPGAEYLFQQQPLFQDQSETEEDGRNPFNFRKHAFHIVFRGQRPGIKMSQYFGGESQNGQADQYQGKTAEYQMAEFVDHDFVEALSMSGSRNANGFDGSGLSFSCGLYIGMLNFA